MTSARHGTTRPGASRQLRGERLQPVEPTTRDDDVRAASREQARGVGTETGGRAGDDDPAALDAHGFSSRRRSGTTRGNLVGTGPAGEQDQVLVQLEPGAVVAVHAG